MGWQLFLSLSVMMFLEYAIWGAWSPVLAARLSGDLKFSGSQTGWIYGTIPIACIISPLIAGQLVDRWIATEWFLGGAQIIGGVLLLIAANKKNFSSLFLVMFLYAICYAPTIPLVNSLMFSQLAKSYADNAAVNAASANIFIWAPIAWVLVGMLLTAWRRTTGSGDSSDCLKFADALSIIMGVFCFVFVPHTPPPGAAGDVLPFVQAFKMLDNTNFLIFIIISFVMTAQLQFYYLGTAQYLSDIGVHSKNVPAVMTIAQIVQTIATLFLLGYLLKLGFRGTLAIGVLSWLVMYLIYSLERPKWLVISSMGFHGIAYVLFIIGGQIYVNSIAPETIRSSAQALLTVATIGFGFLVGTRFTGIVMDHFKAGDKFKWKPIFLVPCALTVACATAFILFFK
ncbi:MAG: MFS transporter [Candidatus Brocadiia bacterium]|nr:MAG: MFS transporter [Candidatus Brocadiia bacterium]